MEAILKAQDIMEPVKDNLSPDELLKDAVNKMRKAWRGEDRLGVKGMNVIDKDGTLIGMLSIKDVIRAVMPAYMEFGEVGELAWDGMLVEMTKKAATKKVSELMTRDVITITENTPIMKCAHLLINHDIQRIPVLNEEKKVVGMIYVRDLYYAITKVLIEE